MKKRDPIVYISDMLNYCESALSFISGLNYSAFIKDEKSIFAVIRAIEVIGESSKKVPKSLKDKYKGIPWREIAGMRDKLVHEYFGINKKVVWNTVKHDIPMLREQIEVIIQEITKNPKLKL